MADPSDNHNMKYRSAMVCGFELSGATCPLTTVTDSNMVNIALLYPRNSVILFNRNKFCFTGGMILGIHIFLLILI